MAKKKAIKKTAKKDAPLKVNTSFENLLKMVVNTPPKKKKK
jgi:hypothetical protein